MSLLGTLDNDLVWQILSILQETHPQSLSQICLTSKKLYVLAPRFLYRTLSLTFDRRRLQRIQRLLHHVSSDEVLISSVREIHIFLLPSEVLHSGDEGQNCLDLLIDLIPRLTGLKRLLYQVEISFAMSSLSPEESRWDHHSGVLPSLLHTLHHYHPNCCLDVTLPPRQDLVSVLALLTHSPCLHSLTTALDDDQRIAFTYLIRVTSTCPNLRKFSVVLRTRNSFGPEYAIYHELQNLGSRSLQLEALVVDGPLVLLQEHLGPASADFLDWSALRELTLINPLNVVLLTHLPLNLRVLCLRLDTVQEFSTVQSISSLFRSLLANQRLETLEVGGSPAMCQAITPEMLEPLGETLCCLKVHGNEDVAGLGKRSVYSRADLERLGQTMGRLHTLGLDINIDEQRPFEILSAISSCFPSLLHLELYLEMNIGHPQRPLQPAMTLKSILKIWTHIWRAMGTARLSQHDLVEYPRLSTLDVNVGSFRVSHNHPSPQDWEQCEQIRFHVRRRERDYEARLGLVTVSCLELDELRTKQGTGPVSSALQGRLVQELQERAEIGLAWRRDTRLDREDSLSNDFQLMLGLENASPFLFEEEKWTPQNSDSVPMSQ